MNLFDDFANNFSDVTKKIRENSKEIKRQTLIKIEIAKEERRLNKSYEELGREFYKINKRLSDGNSNYIDNIMDKIDISISKIEALKTKLSTVFNNVKSEKFDKYKPDESVIYIDERDLK
ncbi:hypothetical protein [Peptoniphilus mikwangii]|uniref:hypothetical protein n=1 Tax=Peptoniphilus mikwangii TaxID=1354300 RepID=UPI00041D832D|nr:hypothetical protein [Peptoniphilus mikwangii]